MLSIDSKLGLCGVLHTATQLGSREKGMAAKRAFMRSAPQLAMGIWKRGAAVAWELSEPGGEISELQLRESAERVSRESSLGASGSEVHSVFSNRGLTNANSNR